ncbi:homeobox-leucine zipper protein HAT14-like [Malania oleifera]|uniref:homeobox-leucine zipper protein HAT14-like n=1 Tax=Malania oleifera TaxID=397392 RepID=UPI0025ADDF64|nr:homeobox-leucine zipper protein HAT14-like [Malania oleifera]
MGSDREKEEACNINTSLGLGVGLGVGGGEYMARDWRRKEKEKKPSVRLDVSFALHPCKQETTVDAARRRRAEGCNNSNVLNVEEEKYYTKSRNSTNISGSARKKLRLTKDQTTLLEHSFKLHTTLNSMDKQILADHLNLRPRQVEVWFQNRRARIKLKQTEADCELLKKWHESLNDENQRLKKELQELRTLKSGPSSLYIQLPKPTTLRMCPSCEKFSKPQGTHG